MQNNINNEFSKIDKQIFYKYKHMLIYKGGNTVNSYLRNIDKNLLKELKFNI